MSRLIVEDKMKHQWRTRRRTTAAVDGHQRWDRAYHLLLQWTDIPAPVCSTRLTPTIPQEVPHARRSLRSCLDQHAGPPADD